LHLPKVVKFNRGSTNNDEILLGRGIQVKVQENLYIHHKIEPPMVIKSKGCVKDSNISTKDTFPLVLQQDTLGGKPRRKDIKLHLHNCMVIWDIFVCIQVIMLTLTSPMKTESVLTTRILPSQRTSSKLSTLGYNLLSIIEKVRKLCPLHMIHLHLYTPHI